MSVGAENRAHEQGQATFVAKTLDLSASSGDLYVEPQTIWGMLNLMLRIFFTVFLFFFANIAVAQTARNALSNQTELNLMACNTETATTNIREGPSAGEFPIVGQLLNGQEVAVLGRIENAKGFNYYKIVYFVELGGGSLYEKEGYVYHAALAETCNIDINKAVQKNTKFPVLQGSYGCKASLPNEDTLSAWGFVSSELVSDQGGILNILTPLCQVSEGDTVDILEYLGKENGVNIYHFKVRLDGCVYRYQIERTTAGMSAGLFHTPECPGEASGNRELSISGVDAVGNIFALGMTMFMGGMDFISGGSLSSAPSGGYIIDRDTAMKSELESCESYYTKGGILTDIGIGNGGNYSYCVIDYCGQISNGSWFCAAEPVM
jgi:hypothetical protein